MKEKVKEFFSKDIRKIVLMLFILQFILYVFITPNRYDDAFYIEKITGTSIIEFITERYHNWTSRFMIEFSLCMVLKISRFAWILGQAFVMTLIGYSIMKIFVRDEKKELLGLVLALVFTYPLDRMSSAGWGATTVNYMWPLAGAMFSLIGLKKIWYKEKISWYLYPLYVFGLVYGCNQEQVCVFMLFIHVLFTILLIARDKKKVSKFLILQDLFVILSLLAVIVCPGNAVRKASETITAYPDFETLSIIDKLSLGVTSTVSELITSPNIVFIVFSTFLAVVVFSMYKDEFVRIVSLIPVLSVAVFGVFKDILTRVFPYYDMYRNLIVQNKVMINSGNYTELTNFLPLMTSLVILGSIVICMLLIFKKLKNSLATYIFIVGFGTRCAMALSPTIFVSTNRTFAFFEFAMLICTLLIYQEYCKKDDKTDKKIQNKLVWFAKVVGVLEYINVLLFIMITQMV